MGAKGEKEGAGAKRRRGLARTCRGRRFTRQPRGARSSARGRPASQRPQAQPDSRPWPAECVPHGGWTQVPLRSRRSNGETQVRLSTCYLLLHPALLSSVTSPISNMTSPGCQLTRTLPTQPLEPEEPHPHLHPATPATRLPNSPALLAKDDLPACGLKVGKKESRTKQGKSRINCSRRE